MCAQVSSYFGHPVFMFMSIQLGTVFLSIYAHTSKLINGERSAETPDAFLLKDSWTAIFAFNKDVAQQESWLENNDGNECYQEIAATFDIAFKLIHPIWNESFILNVIVILYIGRYLLHLVKMFYNITLLC